MTLIRASNRLLDYKVQQLFSTEMFAFYLTLRFELLNTQLWVSFYNHNLSFEPLEPTYYLYCSIWATTKFLSQLSAFIHVFIGKIWSHLASFLSKYFVLLLLLSKLGQYFWKNARLVTQPTNGFHPRTLFISDLGQRSQLSIIMFVS